MNKEIEFLRARCLELAAALQHNFLHDEHGNRRVVLDSHDFVSTVQALHYFLPPELVPQVLYVSSICTKIEELGENVLKAEQNPFLRFDLAVCAFHFNTQPLSRLLHPTPSVFPPHVAYVPNQGGPLMGYQHMHFAPSPYPIQLHQQQYYQPPVECPPPQVALAFPENVAKDLPKTKDQAVPVQAEECPEKVESICVEEEEMNSVEESKDVAKTQMDEVYMEKKKSTSPIRSFGAIASTSKTNSPLAVTPSSDSPVSIEITSDINFFSGQTLESPLNESTTPKRKSNTHGSIGKSSPGKKLESEMTDMVENNETRDPKATSALKALLNIESNLSRNKLATQEKKRKSKRNSKSKSKTEADNGLVERRLDIDPDIFGCFDPEFIQGVEKQTQTSILWPPAESHFFVVRGAMPMHVAKAKSRILELEKQLRKNYTEPLEEDNQRDHTPSKDKQTARIRTTKAVNDESPESAIFRENIIAMGFDNRSVKSVMLMRHSQRVELMASFESSKHMIKNPSGWLYRKSSKLRKEQTHRNLPKSEFDPSTIQDLPQLEILSDDESGDNQKDEVNNSPIGFWAVQENWNYFPQKTT